MSKNILITGGTGFFGKSILDYHKRNYLGKLTILSRNQDIFFKNFPEFENIKDITFLKGDVNNIELTKKYDWIIHAATPTIDTNDEYLEDVIINGTKNIIKQAKKINCNNILYISSGAVYGNNYQHKVNETDICDPVSVYGKCKLEAEKICQQSNLNIIIARCFAFVGKYLPKDKHFAIGNFIKNALDNKNIVINGDGSSIRSYLYADDLIEQLWSLISYGKSNQIYNIGSDYPISIKELAYLIQKILNNNINIEILNKNVSGVSNYYLPNIDKIKSFGIKITSIEKSIRMSV